MLLHYNAKYWHLCHLHKSPYVNDTVHMNTQLYAAAEIWLLLGRIRVVWYASLSAGHDCELCKNSWTNWDAIWGMDSRGSKEQCVGWGSRSPHMKGHFDGKNGPFPAVNIFTATQQLATLVQWRCQLECNRWDSPPGEYDWTVHVRRCGLMPNYSDHLLLRVLLGECY